MQRAWDLIPLPRPLGLGGYGPQLVCSLSLTLLDTAAGSWAMTQDVEWKQQRQSHGLGQRYWVKHLDETEQKLEGAGGNAQGQSGPYQLELGSQGNPLAKGYQLHSQHLGHPIPRDLENGSSQDTRVRLP